ncbi:MAG TPA: hypothetical protein DCD98_01190 [Syntrophomonas sp.]|jgi:hypothetical protein|nr:hypothetical protein [Syntrophomonas sp.]
MPTWSHFKVLLTGFYLPAEVDIPQPGTYNANNQIKLMLGTGGVSVYRCQRGEGHRLQALSQKEVAEMHPGAGMPKHSRHIR